MKHLVESFPYKPRQTVYYVRDNAVHKGIIVSSEVKCICRIVDTDNVLIDYCNVNILPDSEVNKNDPVIHSVSSEDVHFMYESCQYEYEKISDKEYNIALDKLEPYAI